MTDKSWIKPALLVPSPPKCASQTLAELLRSACHTTILKPKSGLGAGHLLLNIPPLTRVDKLRQQLGLELPIPNHAIIYGHYPASHHNLKRLARRHRPTAAVIPIRPIGALLCSVIHHIHRFDYGPLDPRCPELVEGCPQVSSMDVSDLFHLLSTLYIPKIHLIIRSWIEAGSQLNLPVILVPFESTTRRQEELSDWFGANLPGNQPDSQQHEQSADVEVIKVNLSQTKPVPLSAIDPTHTSNALSLLDYFFPCDPKIQPLIDYLRSDLHPKQRNKPDRPLLWRWEQQRLTPEPGPTTDAASPRR